MKPTVMLLRHGTMVQDMKVPGETDLKTDRVRDSMLMDPSMKENGEEEREMVEVASEKLMALCNQEDGPRIDSEAELDHTSYYYNNYNIIIILKKL